MSRALDVLRDKGRGTEVCDPRSGACGAGVLMLSEKKGRTAVGSAACALVRYRGCRKADRPWRVEVSRSLKIRRPATRRPSAKCARMCGATWQWNIHIPARAACQCRDFAPRGTTGEQQSVHAVADRVKRERETMQVHRVRFESAVGDALAHDGTYSVRQRLPRRPGAAVDRFKLVGKVGRAVLAHHADPRVDDEHAVRRPWSPRIVGDDRARQPASRPRRVAGDAVLSEAQYTYVPGVSRRSG